LKEEPRPGEGLETPYSFFRAALKRVIG